MKNRYLIYKVDNITSLVDETIYLSDNLILTGELEIYYETDQEVVVDNNKLIKVGDKEVRYNKNNQIAIIDGYMLHYEDDVLFAIYGSPETYHFIYKDNVLVQVGEYKIRYYKEGFVDGIFKSGDNKENEFLKKYHERLDKFLSIEEEAEEELEELKKIDHD